MSTHRNQGGVHASYRAIKAWLNWIWDEFELEGRNPISRVKIPSGKNQPLSGITMANVHKILKTCKTDMALRDKAQILSLVDTGVRRAEIVSLNIENVDLITAAVHVKHGKGDKFRIVYLGENSRRALRRHLNKTHFDNWSKNSKRRGWSRLVVMRF